MATPHSLVLLAFRPECNTSAPITTQPRAPRLRHGPATTNASPHPPRGAVRQYSRPRPGGTRTGQIETRGPTGRSWTPPTRVHSPRPGYPEQERHQPQPDVYWLREPPSMRRESAQDQLHLPSPHRASPVGDRVNSLCGTPRPVTPTIAGSSQKSGLQKSGHTRTPCGSKSGPSTPPPQLREFPVLDASMAAR